MKKKMNLLSITMLGIFILFSNLSAETIKEVKIKTNAHCGNCKTKIESGIGKLDGVKSASVEMKDKIATISYDEEKIKAENLKSSIVEMGYKADIIKTTSTTNKENKSLKDGKKGNLNIIK